MLNLITEQKFVRSMNEGFIALDPSLQINAHYTLCFTLLRCICP